MVIGSSNFPELQNQSLLNAVLCHTEDILFFFFFFFGGKFYPSAGRYSQRILCSNDKGLEN